MRNALMGNTCYVVATVTVADWRMTVGFRALLMAVCRCPSPSPSLIPNTGSPIWVHLSSLALFGIGCPPFPRRIAPRREVRRLRRQIIYGISFFASWFRPPRPVTQIASEILFREHTAKIDRDRTALITSRLNVSQLSFGGVEKK